MTSSVDKAKFNISLYITLRCNQVDILSYINQIFKHIDLPLRHMSDIFDIAVNPNFGSKYFDIERAFR